MPQPPSPFTDAIYQLLGHFAAELSAHGAMEHSVHAYIFGGCAVHLHVTSRVSSDLDLEITEAVLPRGVLEKAKQATEYVLNKKSEEDEPDLLELDLTYSSVLGPLHEDFDTRAMLIERKPGSPLVVFLPSAEDLALSKLGRLSEVDVADILALMRSPGASWGLLEQLTQETAGYYPAPAGDLTSKLAYVINHCRESIK